MIMPGRVTGKALPISGIVFYCLSEHKNYFNITVNPESIITAVTASQKSMNNTTAVPQPQNNPFLGNVVYFSCNNNACR